MTDPAKTPTVDPAATSTPEPDAAEGPNPRIIVGFLSVMIAIQAFYAGVEILGGGLDTAHPIRAVTGVAYFAYAALVGVFVIGVVLRKRWAWMLAIVLCIFGLSLSGLQILAGDPAEQHVLGLIIDAGILYYLFKPSIRRMFGA